MRGIAHVMRLWFPAISAKCTRNVYIADYGESDRRGSHAFLVCGQLYVGEGVAVRGIVTRARGAS